MPERRYTLVSCYLSLHQQSLRGTPKKHIVRILEMDYRYLAPKFLDLGLGKCERYTEDVKQEAQICGARNCGERVNEVELSRNYGNEAGHIPSDMIATDYNYGEVSR